MGATAVLERVIVGVIVSYFAAGAYNEIDLEKADSVNSPPMVTTAVYDGIEFASPAEAIIFKRETTRNRWFIWAGHVGMPVCYALLAAAFGCYGGLFHEIYNAIFKAKRTRRRYLFGLAIGPFFYGIIGLLPFLLIESDSFPVPRLATLLATCLVGGCFAEETWRFLSTLPGKIFKRLED